MIITVRAQNSILSRKVLKHIKGAEQRFDFDKKSVLVIGGINFLCTFVIPLPMIWDRICAIYFCLACLGSLVFRCILISLVCSV